MIIWVVLTVNSYKKNAAYDLLRKLSRSVYEANPELQDEYSTTNYVQLKDVVDRLCQDYQNPRNIDKIGIAQGKVDQTKNVMQKNVEGMVKNIQDAEVGRF